MSDTACCLLVPPWFFQVSTHGRQGDFETREQSRLRKMAAMYVRPQQAGGGKLRLLSHKGSTA